ncbi:MAG: transposase, partial [Candidatus Thiodiazotropha sp.]
EAKQADVRSARKLRLNPGSIFAMDRAYNDFKLFERWSEEGVFFVTRMKEATCYEVLERREVPQHRPILSDEIIELSSKKAREDCPRQLRRVVVWDEEKQREIVLLTNHLSFGATTISQIYRERWQIELFFKWIVSAPESTSIHPACT